MDVVADQIRTDLVEAVRWSADFSGRSAQTSLGPSEVGHPCDRKLAYGLAAHPVARRTDPLAAFLGTGAHSALEHTFRTWQGQSHHAAARAADNPTDAQALHAASLAPYRDNPRYEVETPLYIPGLEAPGTCDLFDRHLSTVIDHKVVGAWSMHRARVYGPSALYRTQAHLYGLGWQERTGTAPEHVAIAYWPRERSERYGVRVDLNYVWVWSEPYDPNVAHRALDRLAHISDLVEVLDTHAYPQLFEAFDITPEGCRFCDWYNPGATDPGQGCTGM